MFQVSGLKLLIDEYEWSNEWWIANALNGDMILHGFLIYL